GAALAAGGARIYDAWRELAREAEGEFLPGGPWPAAGHAVTATYRGVQFHVDRGGPLGGVRVRAERRSGGPGYVVYDAGMEAFLPAATLRGGPGGYRSLTERPPPRLASRPLLLPPHALRAPGG